MILAGLLLAASLALAGPRVIPADAVDPQEAQALFRGRRLALLVGPSSFGGGGFPDLRYSGQDVTALEEVLLDPERGHFDEVITLTDPSESGRTGVLGAMRALEQRVISADDTVFVYFSTHGTLADDGAGDLDQYLVLADTRLDDVRGSALAHDEVLGWLERLPSRRKVLLLATCHSGQGKSVVSPDMARAMAGTKGLAIPPLREVSEAVVVIGVCAWNEVARESEALGHDIYTHFFLEALEGGDGDVDGDGAVTVTEAHDHARRATWDFTGGTQRAYARAEITGADPVVLAGERTQQGQGLLASYQASLEGLVVLIDGLVKGELPGQVVVPPGQHVVVLEDAEGRVVSRQRVALGEGERLDARKLLHRDHLRMATGLGFSAIADPMPSGPVGRGELHLPRFPGHGWETILHGAAMVRWPRPVLEGGITMEHPIRYGTWQLRGGLDLHGYLLQSDTDGRWFSDEQGGEPQLLAPSLAPQPVLSLCWLPSYPAMARLAVSGGYLWYTDSGVWHHAWSGNVSLVLGGRF